MQSTFLNRVKDNPTVFALIALLITSIAYFYVVFKYSVNVPCSDDYDAILDLVNRFGASTPSEKLSLLFRNHMEHRIVFCRVIVLLDHSIFGQINFVRLIFWGNLSMIGLLWLFYKMLPAVENKILYFIPIPFLFLNLQQYENAIWAMASLQNLYVVFFSILSLYLLNKGNFSSLIGAILTALLASYTSGSGLFALIAGLILLVLCKRRKTHVMIWLLASAVIFYTYFSNYISPNPDFKLSEALLHSPDKIIGNFFALTGGGLTFEKHYEAAFNTIGFLTAILAGYAISVLFLYLLYKKYFLKNPFFFSVVVFFFIVFLSVATSRISFGAEYIADTGRYKINSIAFYVIVYLIFLDLNFQKIKRLQFFLIMILSIIFWASPIGEIWGPSRQLKKVW